MVNGMTDRRIDLILFGVAVIIRLAFLFTSVQAHGDLLPATVELENYYKLGNNILAGHGFSAALEPPFFPDSLRGPLYPGFIAVILYLGGSLWAVMLAQIIIGSAIPLLGRRISYKIIPDRRVAILVGLALAVEPLTARLAAVLLTETLFIFLFLSSILALWRYFEGRRSWNLYSSALFLGLATLARPAAQYLPALFILFILYHHRKTIPRYLAAYPAMIFLAIFLIVLSPWMYRNYKVFGSPALAVTKVTNLYTYLVPSAIALEENIPFEKAKAQFFAQEGIQNIDVINLENAAYFQKRAMEVLKKHPTGLFKSALVGLFAFFTHDGYLDILQSFGYLRSPPSPSEILQTIPSLPSGPVLMVIAGRIIWALVACAFAAGAFKFLKRERITIQALMALSLVAYFALVTTVVGFGVTARYRAPVNLFILAFAFYAGAKWFGFDINKNRSSYQPGASRQWTGAFFRPEDRQK